MRLASVLFSLVALSGVAWAQDAPSPDSDEITGCTPGSALGTLETVFVQARVFNTGALFFGGDYTSGDGYFVPRIDEHSPVFASGLWLGGLVDGERRVAAARYGNWNFWPGPIADPDDPPDDCAAYDRIYRVSRQDVARYLVLGEATDDLRDWPAELGAPVFDGDGDPGNYNLAGGDQPAISGDVAVWWLMNDAANEHPATGSTLPLGVEVRVLAFAFEDPRDRSLSETTFYRYEVTNRRDVPIEHAYASIFSDPDLGDAGDDYIGTDTLGQMVFVYNDNAEDAVYGIPPAWGIQVLQGPVVDGDTLGATDTSTFISGGPAGTTEPGTAEEYYNYMQGLWGDGTPITASGQGYQTRGEVSPFFYPGDPATESFWSEVNIDGSGTNSTSGDRRMVVSTGPFRLAPGDTQTILYAMPFARGADWLNSVTVLKALAQRLAGLHADGRFASRPVVAEEYDGYSPPQEPTSVTLTSVRPNPSSGAAEAVLELSESAHVRADLYDVLGRQVATLVDREMPVGETVLAVPTALPAGTYVLRVVVDRAGHTDLPFVIAR